MHKVLKEIVKQKILFGFGLGFDSNLFSKEDGLKLMKEYNSILKKKKDLEWLMYEHDKIDDWVNSKETVVQLIEKVESLE